jgi:hypothetical protein
VALACSGRVAIVVKAVVQELGVQLGPFPLGLEALTGHRLTLTRDTTVLSLLRDVSEHELLVVPLQRKEQLDGQRTRYSGRDLRSLGVRDLGQRWFSSALGGVKRNGLPIGTYAAFRRGFCSGPSLPPRRGRSLDATDLNERSRQLRRPLWAVQAPTQLYSQTAHWWQSFWNSTTAPATRGAKRNPP